jgi:hypothetical protein
MLGPSLSGLLRTLAAQPAESRTENQNALLEELALLFAASSQVQVTQQRNDETLSIQIQAPLKPKDFGILSYTRPKKPDLDVYTRPQQSDKCTCCGQKLPSSGIVAGA